MLLYQKYFELVAHVKCKNSLISTLPVVGLGCPGIFLSTFLQLVSGSKSSILNWVMKLNLFIFFFFFFFVLETSLKDFPFYSPILLTLWFTYIQTRIKESYMHLSGQLYFKTPSRTKIPRKFQEKCIFQQSVGDPNFKKFSIWYVPWGHPIEPLS